MQPLKQVWILQKIKRLILPKKNEHMENIFGNIELIPVSANFFNPSISKIQPEIPKPKQSKVPVIRQSLDYQQVKKRSGFIKDIQQLKKTINETQQKNLLLCNGIMSLAPDFAHVLFESKNYQNQNYGSFEELKLLEQKLLSDLDKLYEENCLLEKQLNRVKFIQQNEEKLKSESFDNSIDHYQFLRNVWHNKNQSKSYSQDSNPCEDLIEKLNKKVATVRFSINHILKEQQSNQSNPSSTHQIQNDFISKSNKFQQLLALYERASMQIEDLKSHSWGHSEERDKEETLDIENQQKSAHIQNLNFRIKFLENKVNENQRQVRLLKDQLESKDKQLSKLKNTEFKLQYVFTQQKRIRENQIRQKDQIQIRVYNFSQSSDQKVEYYDVDSSIQSFIETLKNQAKMIEESLKDKSSLNLYLEKISAFSNEKSISLKKSSNDFESNKKNTDRLNQVDMNKIKTDRLSLIKKTNKLTETLNDSNALRRKSSKERYQRVSKTSLQDKQNSNPIGYFECYKEDGIDFPSEVGLINLEKDLKAKFVRTTNRTKRENLR